MSFGVRVAGWITLSVVGGVVIALPDADERVVSFSEAHGPSLFDLAGVFLALAGWAVFLHALWRRRDRLAMARGTVVSDILLFALGLGAGLVIASVVSGFAWWWAIGVGLLVAAQRVCAALIGRRGT